VHELDHFCAALCSLSSSRENAARVCLPEVILFCVNGNGADESDINFCRQKVFRHCRLINKVKRSKLLVLKPPTAAVASFPAQFISNQGLPSLCLY
jgi:hypothetical protein